MALLAAYSFDEGSGTTAADASGNGNTIDLTGSTVGFDAGGHTNSGLTSSGTTPASFPSDIGQTAIRTVMAWMRGSWSVTGFAIEWHVPSIDSGSWGILALSGQIHIQARNASTIARASVAWPADGEWHHIAGTYDGSNVRIYLDGTLANSTALASPLRIDADPPKLFSFVAAQSGNIIDDLRIYDEALDQSTIATLMSTPVTSAGPGEVVGTADAAFGFNATATGLREVVGSGNAAFGFSATATQEATSSGSTLLASYSFDEDGDLVLDRSGNHNDFTIAGTGAIRIPDGHTNKGLARTGSVLPTLPLIGQTAHRTVMLWGFGNGGVWNVRWQLDSLNTGVWGILNLNNEIGVRARNSSGTVVFPRVANPNDSAWHHYCGTYDGSTVRFYLDGVEVASSALVGPIHNEADRLDLLDGNGFVVPGIAVDDLRIYDGALTAYEITQAMNTPVVDTSNGGSSGVYAWNGSEWVETPAVQAWNGSQWVESPGFVTL